MVAATLAPEGTAEYLSPEQIVGEPGDQRSDIYGWGVVMYELLAGRVPHTGTDPAAAMQAHLGNAVIPLRDVRDDIPPGLEAVVLTALRRRPEQRYPSALAVLGDLDRVDELNPDDYDLSAEPAMAVGGRRVRSGGPTAICSPHRGRLHRCRRHRTPGHRRSAIDRPMTSG